MRVVPFIAACFLLSACATPEQLEAQRQMQLQQDVGTCQSYGFRMKSDAFANCMLQLDIARQQRYNNYYYGYGGYYGHRHPGSSIGYYIHR